MTLETALWIERYLDSLPEPRRIEFHDVFGARHRMKAHSIGRITESTPRTRRLKRQFQTSRRAEDGYDYDL